MTALAHDPSPRAASPDLPGLAREYRAQAAVIRTAPTGRCSEAYHRIDEIAVDLQSAGARELVHLLAAERRTADDVVELLLDIAPSRDVRAAVDTLSRSMAAVDTALHTAPGDRGSTAHVPHHP